MDVQMRTYVQRVIETERRVQLLLVRTFNI